MTLQFLLGTGQTNAHELMLTKAQNWLDKDENNRVFFLVPNYNKFEQETAILKGMQQLTGEASFSTVRLQVFSFYRLAWYFLQKNGLMAGNLLTDAGNAMVLRKVVEEEEPHLTVFKGETQKNGFIMQLADFYQELKIGNVSIEDLLLLQEGDSAQAQDRQLKLQDLYRIYNRYESELEANQVDVADVHLLLADFLNQQPMENTLFIVTGFSQFNARELQILLAIMNQSHLYLNLLAGKEELQQPASPIDLFFESHRTYHQLKQFADQMKIPVYFDQLAEKLPTPFNQIASFLEGKEAIDQALPLKIWQFETPLAEVRRIANEIRRLVGEEDYRYQDIEILTRDFVTYGELLPTIFQQMEIPYYLDQDQEMADHPLVEFLRALFLIDEYNYRIKDVFRLLKTELFIPEQWEETEWEQKRNQFREAVDIAENVCLAYQFQGNAWLNENDWEFIDYDYILEEEQDIADEEVIVNRVRRLIKTYLPPFYYKIQHAVTGKDAAMIFYQFLLDSGAEHQLETWRDQEVLAGNLEKARNHEQTWQALIGLLEEYLLIYGETEFDWTSFKEIFLTGLENLTYGKIPSAIDQVQINNFDLTRRQQNKVIFALGLNEHVFPARFQSQSLLSLEEKEFITEQLPENKYLPEDPSTKITREPFLAYLVFLSATEHLYLSYAANQDTQKDLKISPFVERLSKGAGIQIDSIDSLSLNSRPEDFVGTYRTLITDLTYLERLSIDQNQPLLNHWLILRKYLLKSKLKKLAETVFASLAYKNLPKDLTPELAEELYGKNLYVSVSRLESYHQCQFQYFAQYGLRLREREIYGLTPAAAGDFYHEALDRFFKVLESARLDLANLTDRERKGLTEEVLKEIFGEKRFAILSSSPRMNYIRYQLAETIKKMSWAMSEHAKLMDFKTLRTEVLFGVLQGARGIPGLEEPLNNGGKLAVRGKIDRLDHFSKGQEEWLSVVDYKSSDRAFDVVEAYYGLAMQLVTYLDVALTDSAALVGEKPVKPAGAYYLHVHNPILKSEDDLEAERLKKYNYDGLFVDSPEVLEHLAPGLEEKDRSPIFPVMTDKNGEYKKNDRTNKKFYTEDELQLLMKHNRDNMRTAGNDILCGKIKLDPAYRKKEAIACKFCPFRSVCGFDVMLKENNYHRLQEMTKDEIMKRIGGAESNEQTSNETRE